jgi:hypothetical protein
MPKHLNIYNLLKYKVYFKIYFLLQVTFSIPKIGSPTMNFLKNGEKEGFLNFIDFCKNIL